ncbi:protein preY, mitochondrial [Narcine bancroftii]|uniref:protein preY, mitochondrial n=1 Tax=Narcine bancroftii TaxID=1343680 RepID=UPI0038322298
MLKAVRRLVRGAGSRWGLLVAPRYCSAGPEAPGPQLDPELIACLVCPLSRRRLRYEESSNQLINDELGIAYPIVDGIPNMIPQEARLIQKAEGNSKQ